MSQDIIKPSNGRIVLFTPGPDFAGIWHDQSQQLAASICHVWGDRMVNLDVIDSNGIHHAVTSVCLVQPGDSKVYEDRYCEWMPYQIASNRSVELAKHVAEINPPEERLPASRRCMGDLALADCPFPNCDCPGGNWKKPYDEAPAALRDSFEGRSSVPGRACDCGGPGFCTCGKP